MPPLDLGEQRLDALGRRADHLQPRPARARRRPANADSSTGRPLRSSSRPTNRIRSRSPRGFGPCGAAAEVDPVRDHLVAPAEVALAGPAGGLRDGDPRVQLVEDAARSERAWRSRSGATSPSRRGRCRPPARRRSRHASQPTIGAIGSCTCTTSKRPGAQLAAQAHDRLGRDATGSTPRRSAAARPCGRAGSGSRAADRASGRRRWTARVRRSSGSTGDSTRTWWPCGDQLGAPARRRAGSRRPEKSRSKERRGRFASARCYQ